MPNYGVIDLGSNTVRLCIYEVKNDDKEVYSKKDLRSLLNNKVMAGLASHVVDGAFTEQGIIHATDVLAGHSKRLKYFDCKRVDVFATAVLRNCSNSAEVIRTIEAKSGFCITLLSAQEEAHLGFVGASSERILTQGTLIDIGGGSSELTCIAEGTDTDNSSIGQGSLSSFSEYVQGILPTKAEADAIRKGFTEKLAACSTKDAYDNDRFFGIGGSVRASVKMHAEAFGGGNRPEVLTRKDIDRILEFYEKDPNAFAHTALKAVPDRIHTIVPGCVIIRTLLKEYGVDELSICKKGVREGYLIERMLLGRAVACG